MLTTRWLILSVLVTLCVACGNPSDAEVDARGGPADASQGDAGDGMAIVDVRIDASLDHATVRFSTPRAATAVIAFGAGGLDRTLVNDHSTTRHVNLLTGLDPQTTYQVRITVDDGDGQETSLDSSFHTGTLIDVSIPAGQTVTWDEAGSPYVIQPGFSVAIDGELIVNAGVRITGGSSLTNRNVLRIEGTPEAPVIVETYIQTGSSGDVDPSRLFSATGATFRASMRHYGARVDVSGARFEKFVELLDVAATSAVTASALPCGERFQVSSANDLDLSNNLVRGAVSAFGAGALSLTGSSFIPCDNTLVQVRADSQTATVIDASAAHWGGVVDLEQIRARLGPNLQDCTNDCISIADPRVDPAMATPTQQD